MQVCQHSDSDSRTFAIGDGGTEVMKEDDDGRVYVHYTGPENR